MRCEAEFYQGWGWAELSMGELTEEGVVGEMWQSRGKVRCVRRVSEGRQVEMTTTDALSVFDEVLPVSIPHKGEILTRLTALFFGKLKGVPHWQPRQVAPNRLEGLYARPIPVELIVRGALSGHAWRLYQQGERRLCGVVLSEGLKENDLLDAPIVTPTTKERDRDRDATPEELLQSGRVSAGDYGAMQAYALSAYEQGSAYAEGRGLLLLDSKYEFGKLPSGELVMIDELHTPDSARFVGLENHKAVMEGGGALVHLSKEHVRQQMLYKRRKGQEMDYSSDWTQEVSEHYQRVYELLSGKKFVSEFSG